MERSGRVRAATIGDKEIDVSYPPIAEHGLIGDLQTAALVTTDGTIDWFCCPRFDSPSVFGALLDDEKGGRFAIRRPTNVSPSRCSSPTPRCWSRDSSPRAGWPSSSTSCPSRVPTRSPTGIGWSVGSVVCGAMSTSIYGSSRGSTTAANPITPKLTAPMLASSRAGSRSTYLDMAAREHDGDIRATSPSSRRSSGVVSSRARTDIRPCSGTGPSYNFSMTP